MLHVHILGICGTFMSSLAILAAKMGCKVSGQDIHAYPPMSLQLEQHNIPIIDNYQAKSLAKDADIIVVGNVMTRGMPVVEEILNARLAYTSGPAFLARYILADQHVVVVAGTHGKTTTTSLLTWILYKANLEPGYLIGGSPNNFESSAKLGGGKIFVLEGDEYDSAFFDKRSKFIHYRPQTLIINNLEYDHADIFPDLNAIQNQLHHLIRTVPANGLIIHPRNDANINRVLARGCWTPCQDFDLDSGSWNVAQLNSDKYDLPIIGRHNQSNALAAIAAAYHLGVPIESSCQALMNLQVLRED